MKATLIPAFLLMSASVVSGFFTSKAAPVKSLRSDEAFRIFKEKYPDRAARKRAPWASWGVPRADFDGTKFKVVEKEGTMGERMSDIDEKRARASFTELAKLYGEDEAIEMVRIMPLILAFNKDCFAASLEEWSKIFGAEESKAMVLRNPGLLAVQPREAACATDQTMTFSYIVAATRPLGPVLLPGTLFLLSTPLLEEVTGIPIRSSFLGLF